MIYGGLAHAIDCLAAERHRTGLGAYAYYTTSLLCNHLPGDRLGYQKCTLDVDPQYLVHVCLSDALSKFTGCDADVIHENINPSEGLNCLSDRSLDFTAFRNIQSNGKDFSSHFFNFLNQFQRHRNVTQTQNNVGACGSARKSARSAYSA